MRPAAAWSARSRPRSSGIAHDGDRAIVLRPSRSPDGARCVTVGDGTADDFPNLRYAMPDELPDAACACSRASGRAPIELHHLVGHHPAVLDLLGGLGVPYDVHVHDYAWLCGRVALVGPAQRYCGEPAVAQCEACVADAGNLIDEDITVAALRRRSAQAARGRAARGGAIRGCRRAHPPPFPRDASGGAAA